LGQLDKLIASHIDGKKLPGAVTAVMRKGQLVHCNVQGWSDIENQIPLQINSLFRIYSLTKIVTSVALLSLYEQGHLDITDPVARWIPAFAEQKVQKEDGNTEPVTRPTTIYDLLRHCGGLAADHDLEELLASDHTLESFVAEQADLPLAAQPATKWLYGYSTDVLARIIEIVAEMPFDVFLKERIFQPLGMEDTCFTPNEEQAKRLTVCYHYSADGQLSPMDGNGHDSLFRRKNRYLSGSAGLLSTAADYLRFSTMLLNNGQLDGCRILGRKTVELMTLDHLPNNHPNIEIGIQSFRFGLGVSVMTDVARSRALSSLGDFGWGGAAGTQVWIDPREDMITMIMIQVRSDVATGIMDVTKRLAYQALV